MATRHINHTILDEITKTSFPFYVDYFHAISLKEEQKDIFLTNAQSVMITPYANFDAYDVMAKVINPLKEQGYLKVDGEKLLVPLEGLLVVPDVATTTKFPLVIIAHGQHLGHFYVPNTQPTTTSNGHFTFMKPQELHESLPDETLSYRGYQALQNELSKKGPHRGGPVASFSINLNIVNDLNSTYVTDPSTNYFEKQAVDFNQRILLTFLHLKLLKIIAVEPIDPTSGDDQPIKFLDGTTFKNLSSVMANPVLDHAGLQDLRDLVRNKIDFNKLGFMGHSRGADAVSRLPAYFFEGATAPGPTFPVRKEVDDRIKALAVQIGRPRREFIKCILALEPTAEINKAAINEEKPDRHNGYVIDNKETVYFVVVGTHDEDVTLDPVRIYEFPECPKVMIAINGATHKLFNSVWVKMFSLKKLRELETSAITVGQHERLLNNVAESCFKGTLGGEPSLLLRFTKKTDFVIDLPNGIDDFQSAWKFGFPFTANTPVTLDKKVTSVSQKNIKGQGYKFEQDLTAFFVEKNNEGTVTIRIPIDPEKLSNFSHFSFRFAKGFDVKSAAIQGETKNFTIQFFENDTPVGKPIAGGDIVSLKLRAFRAFDETRNDENEPEIDWSILMQTAEITLPESTALPRITRIDISVIPDVTKSPPRSTAKVVFGTIAGALGGGLLGGAGGALYSAKRDPEDPAEDMLIGGAVFAALGVAGTLVIFKADKHAFVFKDFLLTNRQFE